DAHQLEQVMMNLATNARDAMQHGGVFSVTTGQIRLDKEFITTHGYGQPGMYALITVSDTGKGMDEATRQRIFEPFFTTKELGKGTGLGLAVVYGIINSHGGRIEVESTKDVGTTFTLYFPVPVQTQSPAEVRAEPEIINSKKEHHTILVVEDEEMLLLLLK